MNSKKLLPIVAGLSVISFVGAGCSNPVDTLKQKVADKVTSSVANGTVGALTGGQVQVDGNSDSKNFAFKDNKTGNSIAIGEDVKIPDDFPKELPICAGAKANSVSLQKNGDQEAALVMNSSDNVATVTKWYEGQAKSAGWTEEENSTLGTSEMRSYSKNGATFSLMIGSGESTSGSVMTLTYKPAPKSDTSTSTQ